MPTLSEIGVSISSNRWTSSSSRVLACTDNGFPSNRPTAGNSRVVGKTRDELKTLVCVTGQHREMLDQVLQAFNVIPEYDLSIMKSQTIQQRDFLILLPQR